MAFGDSEVRTVDKSGYFVANLDTYGGNSGSAVFNTDTGLVEGILVRGENDFVYSNGCRVSNVCPAPGCRGEDVTKISELANLIPEATEEPKQPPKAPTSKWPTSRPTRHVRSSGGCSVVAHEPHSTGPMAVSSPCNHTPHANRAHCHGVVDGSSRRS